MPKEHNDEFKNPREDGGSTSNGTFPVTESNIRIWNNLMYLGIGIIIGFSIALILL